MVREVSQENDGDGTRRDTGRGMRFERHVLYNAHPVGLVLAEHLRDAGLPRVRGPWHIKEK